MKIAFPCRTNLEKERQRDAVRYVSRPRSAPQTVLASSAMAPASARSSAYDSSEPSWGADSSNDPTRTASAAEPEEELRCGKHSGAYRSKAALSSGELPFRAKNPACARVLPRSCDCG